MLISKGNRNPRLGPITTDPHHRNERRMPLRLTREQKILWVEIPMPLINEHGLIGLQQRMGVFRPGAEGSEAHGGNSGQRHRGTPAGALLFAHFVSGGRILSDGGRDFWYFRWW